jgi:integrase
MEEKQSMDKIVDHINRIIAVKSMYPKEIYETLISDGKLKPNSEKEFRNLFEWALSNELIDRTKVKNWNKKKGKIPRYFTKKQLVKLFDAIDRPKDGIASFLALMCGLRISEVCNLKIKDINFDDTKIFIRDSKNTNRHLHGYGKDRVVRFDSAISGTLQRWIEVIGDTSEWFLPSDKSPDLPVRPKTLHERFRYYLKQANLLEPEYEMRFKQKINGKVREKVAHRHKFYFHCLRHTMASIIYNKTGDIYAVKEFLGHESVDTTMVYAKMTETKMRTVISSVFSSLHYNFNENRHTPLPETPPVRSPQIVNSSVNSPLQLLEMQYVNGDINENEFLRKKEVLSATELKRTIELTGDRLWGAKRSGLE